jgi:flagellar motor switch protein FliM
MILEKNIIRKIENLHAGFAEAIHKDFTDAMGVVIDSEIAFVDQTTLAEFIMSLKNPCLSYTFDLEGMSERVIISYSNPVSHALIGKALGQKPDGAFTKEQRDTMTEVFSRNLKDLVSAWEPIQKFEAHNAELETQPEALQQESAPSSTVLLIALEINGPDFSGLMEISYFNDAIQPFSAAFAASKAPGQ